MVYTPSIVTTTSCAFDLTLFPFDTQYCYLEVASYWFSNADLNLTKMPGPAIVLDTFGHLEWTIDYVHTESYVWDFQEVGEVVAYDYIDWEISMTRNSNYYIVNGLLPTLFVTIITLVALWLPDFNSRLHLCITGLLSVFAVQWTMSASLPVTEVITWLEVFSVTCVGTISFICLECCVISQINTFTSEPPAWISYITYHSVLKHVTDATIIDKALALQRLNRMSEQKKKKGVAVYSSSSQEEEEGTGGSDTTNRGPVDFMETDDDDTHTYTDQVQESYAVDRPSREDNTTLSSASKSNSQSPDAPGTRRRRWSSVRKVVDPQYKEGKQSSVKDYEAMNQRTWKLFALTVDNVLKVLLPLLFSAFLAYHGSKLM
jgi:hypothetical protein